MSLEQELPSCVNMRTRAKQGVFSRPQTVRRQRRTWGASHRPRIFSRRCENSELILRVDCPPLLKIWSVSGVVCVCVVRYIKRIELVGVVSAYSIRHSALTAALRPKLPNLPCARGGERSADIYTYNSRLGTLSGAAGLRGDSPLAKNLGGQIVVNFLMRETTTTHSFPFTRKRG